MANGKKSFVLYADLIHTVNKMPNEKAGELFKHILSYVNDEDPITEDLIIQLTFEPIKQQLKRDLNRWENIREKRSLAGQASAKKRKQKATNSTSVKSVQQSSTNSTVTVNDNVTVNVNDISTDVDKEKNYFVEDLMWLYLKDERICEAVIKNKKNKIANHGALENLLETFTNHLKESGVSIKTFKDYCAHFLNWNRKDKTIGKKEKLSAAQALRQKHGISNI